MKKFIITTESGSDLSKEIIDLYNIQVIPMHVTMEDQTYPDGSFDVQKVFDYYEETGNLPKTSGSTPQDNAKVFEEVFAKHPDAYIIHIAYSAVTTVSFNAANIAAQDFKNVYLVDSKHVSIGAAAIVKATAQFIEDNPNTSPEAIIAFVDIIDEYEYHLGLLFAKLPRKGNYINAFMHIFGFFSEYLKTEEKEFILDKFDKYKEDKIHLSVITNLLNIYAIKYEKEYILNQTIWSPYPEELHYISDSGK